MATDKPRLSISMDEETFEKVIAYKEENGIATQSKAIIKIMEMGLNELEREIAQKKSPSTAEAASGEEQMTAPLYSSEAKRLAQDYDTLDSYGKRVVRLVIVEEKIRCEEQAAATARTELHIAAKDGGRSEAEIASEFKIPSGKDFQMLRCKEGIGGRPPAREEK